MLSLVLCLYRYLTLNSWTAVCFVRRVAFIFTFFTFVLHVWFHNKAPFQLRVVSLINRIVAVFTLDVTVINTPFITFLSVYDHACCCCCCCRCFRRSVLIEWHGCPKWYAVTSTPPFPVDPLEPPTVGRVSVWSCCRFTTVGHSELRVTSLV